MSDSSLIETNAVVEHDIYFVSNKFGTLIEHSIRRAVGWISKEHTYITFCIKLTKMVFIIEYVDQAAEHMHMTEVRGLPSENFIWSSLCVRFDIHSIYDIACSGYSFCPKPGWHTVST